MPYEYSVFVSYKQTPGWTRWVRKSFAPALEEALRPNLPDHLGVYCDEELRTGVDFDDDLRYKLSVSRVLVPVFMNPYFLSNACRQECGLMLEREDILGFRTPGNRNVLIIPIRVSSRELFPDLASKIQDADFIEYTGIYPLPDDEPAIHQTKRHIQYGDALREIARDIIAAVRAAPPHDPAWQHLTGKTYPDDLRLKIPPPPLPPRIRAKPRQRSGVAAASP